MTVEPRPSAASSRVYRPDIDGLRAVAVLAVVLFHARLHPFDGGFVGVDVFFVISGYLITGHLTADLRAGRLSIAAFYHRRIRRIFPALFVMTAVSVAAAALVFPPPELTQVGRSLVAMALFASNLFFDWTHVASGYFDTASQGELLLHTWSLSVEEQFYIAMPLGLLLLRGRSDATIVRVLAVAAALSFALSLWAVWARPVDAFYLVFPRAWELLVGGLVAVARLPEPSSRAMREAMAGAGMAMILAAIFGFSQRTAFPGAAALLPCLGTALVIHAGSGGASLVGRGLGLRPVVVVGLLSYSLYLWHWPMLVLMRQVCAGSNDPLPVAAALGLSVAAAALSYRFVETPFRQGFRLPRRAVLAGGVGASLVAAALGVVLVAAQGLPGRFDAATLRRVADNSARAKGHEPGRCGNFGVPLRTKADFTFCAVGHGEPRKLLVWGDSMAEELRPLLTRLYDENGLDHHGIVFALTLGCPPTLSATRPGMPCDRTNRWSLERAKAPDVDTVLVVFAAWWEVYDRSICTARDSVCLRKLPAREAEDVVLADLRGSLTELRRLGKHVVLGLPLPSYNLHIPALETEEAVLPRLTGALRRAGMIRLQRWDYRTLRQRLTAMAEDLGIGLFDPRARLCRGDDCTYAENGVSTYVDHQHIAEGRIGLFHDDLRAALGQAFEPMPETGMRSALRVAP